MGSGNPQSTSPKPTGKKAKKLTQKEQSERFIEAARKIGVDETGEAFEMAVERMLKSPKG
jgi:hypothetical protein